MNPNCLILSILTLKQWIVKISLKLQNQIRIAKGLTMMTPLLNDQSTLTASVTIVKLRGQGIYFILHKRLKI